MNKVFDRTKTLDELDPPAWGEPDSDTYLIATCFRLRHKPIDSFSVEDLRILIGQEIGLAWLIPLALDVLEQDPLSEGDFYPGDLLANVLRVPASFWSREREGRNRVNAILSGLAEIPEELNEAVAEFLEHSA